MDGSEGGVGCITHELQSSQAREVAKGPSRDARELVVVLLRDGEGVGSEAAVDTAHGGVERAELSDRLERGAGRGASRTRYRYCRLVRLLKDPSGMLVSRLWFCSGMGRLYGVKRPSTRRMAGWNAPS